MTVLMRRHSETSATARAAGGGLLATAVTAVITALVTVTLLGCGPREPAPGALLEADGTAVYTDGVYTSTYAVPGDNGWQPYLRLTVKAGLVTEVCYGAVRGVSEESPDTVAAGMSSEPVAAVTTLADDEKYLEQYRLETGLRLNQMMYALERSLIDRQELPVNVFLPSGDGLGSVEWVHWFAVLAEATLDAARDGRTDLATLSNPGPYTATDGSDELGWAGRLTLIFNGGNPVSASFDEIRAEANGSVRIKSDDADYAERYAAATELTPRLVEEELEGQLVAGTVDGVSGATGTSNRVRSLAAQILAQRTPVLLPRHLCAR